MCCMKIAFDHLPSHNSFFHMDSVLSYVTSLSIWPSQTINFFIGSASLFPNYSLQLFSRTLQDPLCPHATLGLAFCMGDK